MKKYILTLVGCVLVFGSCLRDFMDFSGEDDIGIKTNTETSISFNNNNNAIPVTIYSDSSRIDGAAIITVLTGRQSDPIAWTKSERFDFYLRYNLLYNIDGDSIYVSYDPSGSKGVVSARIDEAKITYITIPNLADIEDNDTQKPLLEKKYLVIKGTASFSLSRGTSLLTPKLVNSNPTTSSLVNAGEIAIYELNKDENTESYKVGNASFESNKITLNNGTITYLSYSGNTTLTVKGTKVINIANLN